MWWTCLGDEIVAAGSLRPSVFGLGPASYISYMSWQRGARLRRNIFWRRLVAKEYGHRGCSHNAFPCVLAPVGIDGDRLRHGWRNIASRTDNAVPARCRLRFCTFVATPSGMVIESPTARPFDPQLAATPQHRFRREDCFCLDDGWRFRDVMDYWCLKHALGYPSCRSWGRRLVCADASVHARSLRTASADISPPMPKSMRVVGMQFLITDKRIAIEDYYAHPAHLLISAAFATFVFAMPALYNALPNLPRKYGSSPRPSSMRMSRSGRVARRSCSFG